MKTFAAMAAAILTACAGGPPDKPDKPLDPKDPKSLTAHLVWNTRSQKSYETRFKARLAPPAPSNPVDYEGRCVWVAPGVLFIHSTASGGDEKRIVRAGEKAWVWHPLAEAWVTDKSMGMRGAGRGIQNPDEILAVLAKHLGGASLKSPGVVKAAFSGRDIEKIMKEQGLAGAFDWKESKADVEIEANGDTRLKTFICRSTLVSTDPKAAGTSTYTAQVDVVSYNVTRELTFHDENKKPIPLSKRIIEAIRKLTEENK